MSERRVPFYSGLTGETVQIRVGGDEGVPRALAECEAPTALEWVRESYAVYRTDGEPLDSLQTILPKGTSK